MLEHNAKRREMAGNRSITTTPSLSATPLQSKVGGELSARVVYRATEGRRSTKDDEVTSSPGG
ncbi:MAG: hypothetical protein P9L91_02520 [Candidatus Zophobacter franzmannii]|nr:hypothetical protein [Candidatus Zophobacter franzmannii]